VGFDPTNRCLVGRHFIKIAHGRDFRDVSPNKGVFRGTASEKIDVSVNVEELDTVPSSLVAERFEPINLDITTRHRDEHI